MAAGRTYPRKSPVAQVITITHAGIHEYLLLFVKQKAGAQVQRDGGGEDVP